MNYRDYFSGKRVTQMGLGVLGRGIEDAKFLARMGADLIVTDLKNEKQLAHALTELKDFPLIKFSLGGHNLDDFRNRDLILKAASVPLHSPFLEEARRNGIPIEMDESLFAKLSGATIVGITGTKGKTTTTHLVFDILRSAVAGGLGRSVFLSGNVSGGVSLPLLETVKPEDIVVMELSSWQLQGFGDSAISPHISIFTNFMPDHMNYYAGNIGQYLSDKVNIFRFQKKNDFLITTKSVSKLLNENGYEINSNLMLLEDQTLPDDWKIKLLGRHNRENIKLAILAARALGISDSTTRSAVENFSGVDGRLQLVREKNGVFYYNDTTATSPEAATAGLKTFGDLGKKVVWIGGGTDKNLDYRDLATALSLPFVRARILLPGSATDKIKLLFSGDTHLAALMVDAVSLAYSLAASGDVVLMSPGAASFGLFENEFDRGGQFVEAVLKL